MSVAILWHNEGRSAFVSSDDVRPADGVGRRGAMRLTRTPGMVLNDVDGVGFRYVVTHDGIPVSLHSSHKDAERARDAVPKARAVHFVEWVGYGATFTVTVPAAGRKVSDVMTRGVNVRGTRLQPAASQTVTSSAGTASPRASTQYSPPSRAVNAQDPPDVSASVTTQPSVGGPGGASVSTEPPHPTTSPSSPSKYRMGGA